MPPPGILLLVSASAQFSISPPASAGSPVRDAARWHRRCRRECSPSSPARRHSRAGSPRSAFRTRFPPRRRAACTRMWCRKTVCPARTAADRSPTPSAPSIRVVPRAKHFRRRRVMPHTAQVRQQFAHGNRPGFPREGGHVGMDRLVELQLAALGKLHHRYGRNGLRDRPQAVHRVRAGGHGVLDVRHAEALGPGRAQIDCDSRRQPRYPQPVHLRRNGDADFMLLCRRQ